MKEYFNKDNQFIGPTIIIGICVVIFGFLVLTGINNFANREQSITVTGSTEKYVVSDTAKWTISVSERAYGEGAGIASSRISQKSIENIKNYLLKNGVAEKDITVQTSSLSPICELSPQGYENCSVGVRGQIANQSLVVDSSEVEKIKNLSARVATEINGVNINNNLVEYYFNGLKDIRVGMLQEATKNAKERAEAVAQAGGANVGNITSLSSGVFQVTQKNSVNFDDYGSYDTTSIDKKVTATVKVNFSVR